MASVKLASFLLDLRTTQDKTSFNEETIKCPIKENLSFPTKYFSILPWPELLQFGSVGLTFLPYLSFNPGFISSSLFAYYGLSHFSKELLYQSGWGMGA